MLPNGLTSVELGSFKPQLRNYLADYNRAVAFYGFLREKRGQDVQNGDLLVVHGFHVCSEWGMATFKQINVDDPAIRATVILRFTSKSTNSTGHDGWEYDSPGGRFVINVRVGRQTELDDTESRGQLPVDNITYENQCLFLSTFSVRFRDDIWATLEQNNLKSAPGLQVQGNPTPSPQGPPSPDPKITTSTKSDFFASGIQPSSLNAFHQTTSVCMTC